MTPLEALNTAYYDHYRKENPNYPAAYIPKPDYTDRTTNGLTKMVLDWMRFHGALAERTNTTGRQIKAKSGKRIWIPTAGVRGSSDIHATYRGLSLHIEIKCRATRDRVRPAQVEYARRVRMAGGLYVTVGTWAEFYEWFLQLNRKE